VNYFTEDPLPEMLFPASSLMEDRMSIAVKVSAGDQQYAWTAVLILGAIAACAIAASFYVDASLLEPSMVGP
jgi:hypothetical protein